MIIIVGRICRCLGYEADRGPGATKYSIPRGVAWAWRSQRLGHVREPGTWACLGNVHPPKQSGSAVFMEAVFQGSSLQPFSYLSILPRSN